MFSTSRLSKKLSTIGLIGIFLFLLSGTANAQTCPDNMSHYWKLNETVTPTDFYDSYVDADNAYCDTTACPSPETGILDGAQYFDGMDDEVNVSDDGTFDWGAGDSFSIEYWMKKDSACSGGDVSDNEIIIGREDPTSSLHWWVGISCMDNGEAIFVLTDKDAIGGDDAWVVGDTVVTDGEWYHIVAVRDASTGTISIYVNGTEEASAPASYSAGFDSSIELNMGHLKNAFYYNGILDE